MFYGREKELNELRSAFQNDKKTAVLVYGKRRVGKTTLIKEALRDIQATVIYHTCVESSFEGNLALLSKNICGCLGLPDVKFKDILDVFEFLKAQSKQICLVLDEYQYFKNSLKNNELDSYFQIVIDSLPANIKLVLCGSYIQVMKELLLEDNPLFGRFTNILHLSEMDYYDSARFYPNLSIHEKIAFYAVFGGSPYVLETIDPSKSLKENIEQKLLPQNSILRSHIEHVMLNEVRKHFDIRILETIGNGKRKYSEIRDVVGENSSGHLDKQLKNLLDMNTIHKVLPINRQYDRKKIFYEISDNLMRFYFAFVFPGINILEKIGPSAFYANYLTAGIEEFINLRFESIVCQYFSRQAALGIERDVLDIGSYWFDDPVQRKNGQFDCVLKHSNGYQVFEVKNYIREMTLRECSAEERQIRQINELDITGVGFVCSGGFDFSSSDYRLISGAELYK